METKSFQEIYDFCKTDATYRAYYNLPVWPHDFSSREKYDYYYRSFAPRGLSRAGTFMYCQGQRQLCRFLGVEGLDTPQMVVFADWYQGKIERVDRRTYCHLGWRAFAIHARIDEKGVYIWFEHPIDRNKDSIRFVARSHRLYDEDGVFAEAMAYIEKHLLLPKGRYRDLQLKARIEKERFWTWYKTYREDEKRNAALRHEIMLDSYRKKERDPMTYAECYTMMAQLGLFEELGADRYERYELATELCDIMNR